MRGLQILIQILALFLMVSCSNIKYLPIPIERTEIKVYRDTIKIIDTIKIVPPVEIRTVVPKMDTLRMECPTATAIAWNDSIYLRGHLKSLEIKTTNHSEYRSKTDTVYVIKETPVDVEKPVPYVPKFYKWCLAYSIISIAVIVLMLCLKIKK